MDYTVTMEEINRFNAVSRDDILQELQPIMKAYKTEYLASYLNVSVGTIYSYTKANGNKITFEGYVKLKALENKQN